MEHPLESDYDEVLRLSAVTFTRFSWDASPGAHEVKVRATDDAGNVKPDEVEWNDLGYLYDGVVGHPVEVL